MFGFLSSTEVNAAPIQRAKIASYKQPVNANAAYLAIKNNLSSIGADILMQGSDVTGKGQIIGIVDTGVDPLMPGFINKDGTSKIIKWTDITNEGQGIILGKYKAQGSFVVMDDIRLNVESLKSKSDTYIVGKLPDVLTDEDIYFVAYDPVTSGVFEKVAVDTQLNQIFKEQDTMFEYDRMRQTVKIKIDSQKSLCLVLSSIEPNGEKIVFGFDKHGHGTAMASIIAGYGQSGVSPESEFIVAKVMSTTGYGTWNNIIKGIEYCIRNGAHVVLVGAVSENPVSPSLWASVERLAQANKTHIVMPSGNTGPGVGTLTITSSWNGLVIASGYYPASTFNALFSSRISSDSFYPYSSCGPNSEGGRGVSVTAPAVTAVPEPGYHETLKFVLMDGTSVSAAYAAGSVALLRQGAQQFGLDPLTSTSLSLLDGACPIEELLPVEQGYGSINLVKAWYLLAKGIGDTRLKLVRKWKGDVSGDGVWLRGNALGALPVWVDNFAPSYRHVEIETNVDWLKSQSNFLDISPVSQRSTVIYGLDELPPGFYSGDVLAHDLSTVAIDGKITISMSLPNEYDERENVTFPVTLGGDETLARRFVSVPQSAQSLSFNIEAVGTGARFMLYNPEGLLVEEAWVEGTRSFKVGLPTEGLWQICLFQDPQDGYSGKTVVLVESFLSGVSIEDSGVLGNTHKFVAKSDERAPVILSYLSSNSTSEWRERKSTMIFPGQATFLPIVEVPAHAESICLRFGSTKPGVLRTFIYHFDESLDKWVEIGDAFLDDTCFGQICINNPAKGRYLATVEAYTSELPVYSEIDYFMVKSGETIDGSPAGGLILLDRGTTSIDVPVAKSLDSPATIVIRKGVKGEVLGLIERAGAFEPAIVQLGGTGELKTFRAFKQEGLVTTDAHITIGNKAYQLNKGKVTAPFSLLDIDYGLYQISENRGMFRFSI